MPARESSRPDTLSDFDVLLWNLGQRYRREVLATYERYDLSTLDMLLVKALVQGADTPTALARTLGWATPHVTKVLNRLEARELAERTQHPRDARSVQVALTPVGLELTQNVKRQRQAHLKQVLAGFTPEERKRLRHYLSRLMDAITTSSGTTEDT